MMKIILLLISVHFFISCHDEEASKKSDVKFAVYSKPKILNMHTLRDVTVYNILNPLHLGLVTTNYKGDVFSGAASSWEVSEDNLNFLFKLKKEMYFTNGVKLNCKIVKENFDRITKDYADSAGVKNIRDYKCIDDETFQVFLTDYSNIFLQMLGELRYALVLNEEYISNNTHTIGLGPYRLQSFTQNKTILEIKNDHYMKRLMSPKTIEYHYVESVKEARKKFLKNEVDIVDLKGFPLEENNASSMYYSRLWMFTFGDNVSSKVRKFLAFNLNRSNIIQDQKLQYIYKPAYGASAPFTPGFNESIIIANKNKVENINNTIEILIIENLVPEIILVELQKELTRLGVRHKIIKLSKWNVIKRISSGKYDIWFGSFAVGLIPEIMVNVLFSSKSYFPLIPYRNKSLLIDQKLREIETTLTVTERDRLLKKFESSIYTEALYLPLFFQKTIFLKGKCIDMKNYSLSSSTENLREINIIKGCL